MLEKSPDEVLSFLEAYSKFSHRVPVVVVPTSYNSITEDELARAGASICIIDSGSVLAVFGRGRISGDALSRVSPVAADGYAEGPSLVSGSDGPIDHPL